MPTLFDIFVVILIVAILIQVMCLGDMSNGRKITDEEFEDFLLSLNEEQKVKAAREKALPYRSDARLVQSVDWVSRNR